jgi:RHS repeat-associated protein
VDDERPRIDGSGSAPAGLPSTHAGSPVTLDLGGRVTTLNGASLVYSKQTKLRQVVEAGVTYRQGFDYAQRRIGLQKTGEAAEAYLYDDENIVGVVNATGLAGIQKRILYDGIDHPLWMYDKAKGITVYFEVDIIGNVRRLRGGHVVAPNTTEPPADLGGYRYTAFGQLYPADEGTPYPSFGGEPYEQLLRWQGRPFINLAGGLYDFRARTWSPELGAFLELDSFGYLTPTGTLWSWPGQNPFRYRDPSGRNPAAALLGGSTGFGGVGGVAGGSGWLVAASDAGPLAAAFAAGFIVGDAIAPYVMDPIIDALGNEYYAKGGKQNVKDTGLAGLSDGQIQELYEAATGREKKKLEKELKGRKKRNKSKRGFGPARDDDCD